VTTDDDEAGVAAVAGGSPFHLHLGKVRAGPGFGLGLNKRAGKKSGPSPARPNCRACKLSPNLARTSKKPGPARETRPDQAKMHKNEGPNPARPDVRAQISGPNPARSASPSRPGPGFSGRAVRAGLPMPRCITAPHLGRERPF
jgi:hypothetical protein